LRARTALQTVSHDGLQRVADLEVGAQARLVEDQHGLEALHVIAHAVGERVAVVLERAPEVERGRRAPEAARERDERAAIGTSEPARQAAEECAREKAVRVRERGRLGHGHERREVRAQERVDRGARREAAEIDDRVVGVAGAKTLVERAQSRRRAPRREPFVEPRGDELELRHRGLVRTDRGLRRPADERVQVRAGAVRVDDEHPPTDRREVDRDVRGEDALANASLRAADRQDAARARRARRGRRLRCHRQRRQPAARSGVRGADRPPFVGRGLELFELGSLERRACTRGRRRRDGRSLEARGRDRDGLEANDLRRGAVERALVGERVVERCLLACRGRRFARHRPRSRIGGPNGLVRDRRIARALGRVWRCRVAPRVGRDVAARLRRPGRWGSDALAALLLGHGDSSGNNSTMA
jgi:hypothetical protein